MSVALSGNYYSPAPAPQDMAAIADGGGHSWQLNITAHPGTDPSTATPLHAALNIIEHVASANDSVALPPATGGQFIYVLNTTSNPVSLYTAYNSADSFSAGGQVMTLDANSTTTFISTRRQWTIAYQGAGVANGPFLPLSGGTMTGPLYVTATGSTTARSVQDRAADHINVLDYGAKGDTIGLAGAAITAGTSVLTCSGALFTAADVGKAIIVHGCGASGAPQQGAIAAVTSTTALTVSFTAATTVTSSNLHYGSDDTAAIAAAILAGRNAGKAVYFPSRAYWLASQSASIPLTRAHLNGEGTPANYFPYTNGSVLFISNATTAAFNGVCGTTVRNLAFYYPGIDNSQATPIAYPPLFEADAAVNGEVNNWFDTVRVLNAYRVFHVTTAGSLARTWLSDCLMYGVDAIFYMQSGFADTVMISDCYFGIGAFPEATASPYNLRNYSCANGSVFRLDGVGGGYSYYDGLIWSGGLASTYRYGIQIVSGVLDVSTITGVVFDGIGSVLDVAGSSQITSCAMAGCTIWSSNPSTTSTASNAFNLNTSGACDFAISACYVALSQGSVIWDNQGTLTSLTVSGCRISHWGRSTTAGTYYAYACPGVAPNLFATFSGNTFDGDRTGTSNATIGLYLGDGTVSISGNVFRNCTRPFTATGSSGSVSTTGNTSAGSGAACNDVSSGSMVVRWGVDNVWDLAPQARAPTITAGTGPTLIAGSTDFHGGFTCGTGTGTSATLNFAANPAQAPSCCLISCSDQTVAVGVNLLVYNGFVVHGSADLSGKTIYYRVIP